MVTPGLGASSPVPTDARGLAVDHRPTLAASPSEFQYMDSVVNVCDGAFTPSGINDVHAHGSTDRDR